MRIDLSLLIGLVFMNVTMLMAQERDSLWLLIRQSKPDTNRVQLLIQLGQHYENNNPDSALWIYESVLKLSTEMGYTRGVIGYYTNATYVYNMMGRFDTALVLNLKSVEIAKEFGDPERLAACLNNVGASYMNLERPEEAIESFLQIIPLYERLKDKGRLVTIYNNLCLTYFNLAQYQKSIDCGEKSLQLGREVNNIYDVAIALINLSNSYNKSGQLGKSIELLTEARLLALKSDNDYALLVSTINLGDAHYKQSNFTKAYSHYQEALPLTKKLEARDSESIALRGMAMYHLSQGEIQKAERFISLSLQLATTNNYVGEIGKGYAMLADISLLKKDFKKNIYYSSKSDSIRTMLLNESVAKNVQNVEAKYEAERKQQQIRELEREAKLKDISIGKSQLTILLLVGSLAALVIILLLAGRTYRQKQTLFKKEHQIQQSRILQLESEKQLMATEAVLQGQEEERKRLAKDLHDGLGGLLSGVKFSLTNMKSNVILDSDSALVFERSLDMIDHSIAELRRVAHNMMPEVLVKYGLSEALKSYCNSLRESKIFNIEFQSIGMEAGLPSNAEVFIYRIIQELLNNVVKHAKARQVLVQLTRHGNEMSIIVEDDGIGFDKDILKNSKGDGWSNIHSRVEYLKGKIDVQSNAGQGTSVHLTIPL